MIPIKESGSDKIIAYGTDAMNANGIISALNYYFYKAGIKFEFGTKEEEKK